MAEPSDPAETTGGEPVDLGILGLTDASLLGEGGFGSVYRAQEQALHRWVAVKILAPVRGDEVSRVDRELRALGTLSGHPHIVMVHGTGTTARGAPYIVMELMVGSLGDRLDREGPLPWAEVVAVGIQIAGALETANRAGVLHRDLKPENILVSSLGEVKLADFGIARVEGSTQTSTGAVTTSIAYAAPEILAGVAPSFQSDVYGLAATMYSLLAGAAPFLRSGDTSLVPMIGRISNEPVADLRPLGVPDAVCTVLERALAKEPERRQATALELARDLQAAQRAASVPVTAVMVAGERDVEMSGPHAGGSEPDPETPPAPPGATVSFPTAPGGPVGGSQPPPQYAQQPPPYAPQPPAYAGGPPAYGHQPPYGGPPPGAPPTGGGRKGPNFAVIAAVIVAVLALGVAGFVVLSGGDDESTGGSSRVSGGRRITSIDDVKSAAVQIVARGTFRQPDGVFEESGAGSGFIIDPSGIAVTNNHVVAGAASLAVYVGGATTPINARVLGVSECSDLAVIDLDGDGYPYMEWYEGDVQPPLEVYSAGYPLGDPEFTLTRGIVAKARADGDTNWASVDHVIEHDAAIQPGNSGGALVTADAKIVGVNYAAGSATNQSQFFAIANDIARPMVERLRLGENVDSIGINGQAYLFDDGSSGIWVAGVTAGSPAGATGVKPGDFVLEVAGQTMADDGTMSGYCDVLRTQGAERAVEIKVLRIDTGELLVGELNGRSFEPAEGASGGSSAGGSTGGGSSGESASGGGPTGGSSGGGTSGGSSGGGTSGGSSGPLEYTDFQVLFDDTGELSIDTPVEWGDVRTAPGDDGCPPEITSAVSIADFESDWTSPGVRAKLCRDIVPSLTAEGAVDSQDLSSSCRPGNRQVNDYSGDFHDFAMVVQPYFDCAGTSTGFIVAGLEVKGTSHLVVVQLQMTDLDRDLAAFFDIVDSILVP